MTVKRLTMHIENDGDSETEGEEDSEETIQTIRMMNWRKMTLIEESEEDFEDEESR
jgi:hypothetical protein